MWNPQSTTPGSESSSAGGRRRFTLAEANRALPLVERIVTDVVRTHAEAVGLQSRVARVPQADQPAARRDLDRHLERLEDYVDELTEIGCDLKDYTVGLIDFTGRHEGRDVCLCWKLGEATVAHWHELDAGFAGRRPVTSLSEAE